MRFCVFLAFISLPLYPAPAVKDSCYECHLKLRGKLKSPSSLWANDVHRQNGMTCSICHKGDATVDDLVGSKTKEFIGTFPRQDIAKLCGGCHGDAERMNKASAKLPAGQPTQFQASVHGRRFALGDEASATCIDCHGVHNIRRAADPLSPVAPLRQPDTCGRCHSNPAIMESRKLPVNQVANYRQGAHWKQLSGGGNVAAASCTSCHGDHNMAPAKTLLTSATCQPCHGAGEEVFRNAAHARLETAERSRGCVACHGSHAIRRAPAGGPGA
jgi:DnaJ-class molecular chaperone